nr:MAG TPA: hypothetical protein [Caudoviricetes sp.]
MKLQIRQNVLKPTAARFIRLHFVQVQNLNSGSMENLYLMVGRTS